MVTLCTEVCFAADVGTAKNVLRMSKSSLTIKYNKNEYLSTAALPTLEALTGHVSCTTASLAQARLLSILILMYLQRRSNCSRAKKMGTVGRRLPDLYTGDGCRFVTASVQNG